MEINIEHLEFCHVRCMMKASMKSNSYQVHILLKRQGRLACLLVNVLQGMFHFVYTSYKHIYTHYNLFRKSASCTHVSTILHAVAGLNPASFELQPQFPNKTDNPDDNELTPVTSLTCV